MQENDPTNWGAATWMLAVGMSFFGGVVSWYSKLRAGHTRVFNLIELIGEVVTSGFVGLASFMVLSSLNYPVGICAAAAGISGNMATRLLFLIEQTIEKRFASLNKD
ncbi:phage holin family protein [Nitrosomonas communis]|uniref:phage holin family protein n=1 Tax=Nitrosomonas communis TaxID=44574 RepID=UPI003D29224A